MFTVVACFLVYAFLLDVHETENSEISCVHKNSGELSANESKLFQQISKHASTHPQLKIEDFFFFLNADIVLGRFA